ncbi:MAG: thymidine kinase [Calditrichaeota bacterium]|nr:thymidine kinase [Calditrichota bacterium]MCB0305917.1 thymidine kinase [Calditrichota bacterium]
MFPIIQRNVGWIEVICGCMFSGKSEELIRRLKRATIARQKVAIFKPKIDTRYSEDHIVSHSEAKIPSQVVESAEEIWKGSLESHVVGIDEAQFFDRDLVSVCMKLANMGKRVIVAGLDMDYRGEPFEPIPQLLAVAEYITKIQAICVVCGNPATFTYRTIEDPERVVIGAENIYEARCRNCFIPPGEREQPLFHFASPPARPNTAGKPDQPEKKKPKLKQQKPKKKK